MGTASEATGTASEAEDNVINPVRVVMDGIPHSKLLKCQEMYRADVIRGIKSPSVDPVSVVINSP